ncbi:hypothetical protein F8388_001241 [Cannabis sativa]|uniref:FCP1 homology domain-containing protein n=1 Tax=Cannabis sativa TaxID=3483 RepID=A0A7J6GGL1_CANSA|nr:hypothetical protein F8388_001241 [Cannabis sativa]
MIIVISSRKEEVPCVGLGEDESYFSRLGIGNGGFIHCVESLVVVAAEAEPETQASLHLYTPSFFYIFALPILSISIETLNEHVDMDDDLPAGIESSGRRKNRKKRKTGSTLGTREEATPIETAVNVDTKEAAEIDVKAEEATEVINDTKEGMTEAKVNTELVPTSTKKKRKRKKTPSRGDNTKIESTNHENISLKNIDSGGDLHSETGSALGSMEATPIETAVNVDTKEAAEIDVKAEEATEVIKDTKEEMSEANVNTELVPTSTKKKRKRKKTLSRGDNTKIESTNHENISLKNIDSGGELHSEIGSALGSMEATPIETAVNVNTKEAAEIDVKAEEATEVIKDTKEEMIEANVNTELVPTSTKKKRERKKTLSRGDNTKIESTNHENISLKNIDSGGDLHSETGSALGSMEATPIETAVNVNTKEAAEIDVKAEEATEVINDTKEEMIEANVNTDTNHENISLKNIDSGGDLHSETGSALGSMEATPIETAVNVNTKEAAEIDVKAEEATEVINDTKEEMTEANVNTELVPTSTKKKRRGKKLKSGDSTKIDSTDRESVSLKSIESGGDLHSESVVGISGETSLGGCFPEPIDKNEPEDNRELRRSRRNNKGEQTKTVSPERNNTEHENLNGATSESTSKEREQQLEDDPIVDGTANLESPIRNADSDSKGKKKKKRRKKNNELNDCESIDKLHEGTDMTNVAGSNSSDTKRISPTNDEQIGFSSGVKTASVMKQDDCIEVSGHNPEIQEIKTNKRKKQKCHPEKRKSSESGNTRDLVEDNKQAVDILCEKDSVNHSDTKDISPNTDEKSGFPSGVNTASIMQQDGSTEVSHVPEGKKIETYQRKKPKHHPKKGNSSESGRTLELAVDNNIDDTSSQSLVGYNTSGFVENIGTTSSVIEAVSQQAVDIFCDKDSVNCSDIKSASQKRKKVKKMINKRDSACGNETLNVMIDVSEESYDQKSGKNLVRGNDALNLDGNDCCKNNGDPTDGPSDLLNLDTVNVDTTMEEAPSSQRNEAKDGILLDATTEEGNLFQIPGSLPERKLVSRSQKKLLILDVNGLLVDFVSSGYRQFRPDITISKKAVYKRPYCDEFIEFCFDKFNVGVWSSRMKWNMDKVIEFLFRKSRHKLLFCWDQSHCSATGANTLENYNKPLVFKELRKLWEKLEPNLPWKIGEYDEANTLLLDDSPYKALRNPANTAIFPKPFEYLDRADNSLGPGGDLRTYLEGVALADNVQKYVEQNPFGQQAITKSHSQWGFYRQFLKPKKTP